MSNPAIICDSGTGYLKIGRSNEDFPSFTFPALVGRPLMRYEEKINDIEIKDVMVGDEAAPLRSYLELSHPVDEGIVSNWDDMCLIWEHGFKKLNIETKNSSILMTEPVYNPQSNREKMAEILFEKYQFQNMQVGIQALLSLFAEGLLTSALLDSGDGVTHCIPVVDGYILKHLITRMNIAGRHVTNYLIKLLFLRGYAFNSTADFETVREIKEKFCFVSGNLEQDRKLSNETTCLEKEYKLPDNSTIKIGRERFEAPEIIFNPFLAGHEFKGASEIIYDAINKAPIDTRKALYKSIMVSGGTSMFPGFPTRIENDLSKFYKQNILKGRSEESSSAKIRIEIIDPARRKYNVFIGAAVYARYMMENNPEFWITKKDYEEMGPLCVKKIGEQLSI